MDRWEARVVAEDIATASGTRGAGSRQYRGNLSDAVVFFLDQGIGKK
jgi:hypothetical protein